MNNEIISQKDKGENYISALSYLVFFIPILLIPNSKLTRFHANQGLILFIIATLSSMVIWIPKIGMTISFVIRIALFILFVYGVINSIQGKMIRLPIIGKLNIIK